MVDWKSPAEIVRDLKVLDKLLHGLFGLYIWEYATSMDFEWEFITRKRQFRWPMVFYFLGRYIQLFAMIASLVSLDSPSALPCQSLFRFILFCGFMSIVISSVNLAIRTIALWGNNKYIIAAVIFAASVQSALVIIITIDINGAWVPTIGCLVTGGESYMSALFIYTMCFNAAVFVLTIVKLAKIGTNANSKRLMTQSKLTTIIFADGLIFFIIALLADIVVIVFIALNLNPILKAMFQIPASIVSTIVACRSVRRLMNFSQGRPVAAFRLSTRNPSSNRNKTSRQSQTIQSPTSIRSSPEVHVQMETFTHIEDDFIKMDKSEFIADTDIKSDSQNIV
ncbi:hypothetical protein CPB83DRAFT_140360 [Crepidotus variabilis]|uniref:Uncharacterized protein n=1 Tax=Crepidotus variabilis TaxID=179855 RepID=A0A9P6JI83_9AGAR|nr:hypothetical protein CPB83DRAFT_140360 [Crepidotus variabilis]